MSINLSRKRKYVNEDTEDSKISSFSDKKVLVVHQNNNKLLETILNNQSQILQQLNDIQQIQNKKYKQLNNKIHNLQINITNFESIIPDIIKDKLKDSIGEILFCIQSNIDINQGDDIEQDIISRFNYLL